MHSVDCRVLIGSWLRKVNIYVGPPNLYFHNKA